MSFRTKIFSFEDARRMAQRRLPRLVFDFVEGAAGREVACHRNCSAFDEIELQPRVMQDVAQRSLATGLFGQEFKVPFGIAPMGMCNVVWPGADQMLARSAGKFGLPVCLSTAASSTIEEMAGWAGSKAWFQLYVNGPTEDALAMVERVKSAGYQTLILTVDVPQVSRRVRDLRNGFTMPFRIGPRQFVDFARHPHWALSTLKNGAPQPKNFEKAGGKGFDRQASRAGADWDFLARLRQIWGDNLIVKGVLHPDDARRSRDIGVDAIWVSNHGGRQLDSAPAAISVLPRIRRALGPETPIIFDSGVRSGEDIVKALALGANFVMLGRPVLMAIGAGQQQGLDSYLALLAEEVSVTLAQLGLRDIKDVTADVLVENQSGISAPNSALRLAVGETREHRSKSIG